MKYWQFKNDQASNFTMLPRKSPTKLELQDQSAHAKWFPFFLFSAICSGVSMWYKV